MANQYIPIWKEAPFLRLVLPFIAGILLQWHAGLPVTALWCAAGGLIGMLMLFRSIDSFIRFKNYWMTGVIINLLLFSGGSIVTYYNDIRHDPYWIDQFPQKRSIITAILQEPLSEKTSFFKAKASVEYVCSNDSCKKLTAIILIYFKKPNTENKLSYQTHIAFSKPLQAIPNTGNPGAFDFKRYCALQNIYHQVILKPDEYIILPSPGKHRSGELLFMARENILHVLRQFIPGKIESGLAEALLIGYKDDLDRNLVQSYSNTGVVHVIAISGLHLGLIYGLLILICMPFKNLRYMKGIKPVVIISGLWLFGVLAGGSASVLRSAVMFSFIALGEGIGKKAFIYNSLAASAFLLLCYNPFWLWDAGFQLSYSAVLSIVVFWRPVYNWILIHNKMLDYIWKLNSVSFAAQILTAPVSIYQFRQFPVYFLLTNLLAVPLSGLIVLGEILLCACSGINWMATATGIAIYHGIKAMNGFISHMESMPFSVWDHLHLSFLQLILIYLFLTACMIYLFCKNKHALITTLILGFIFMGIRSLSFHRAHRQNKLIVYNITKFQAIDIIQGRHVSFIGSKAITEPTSLFRFHIRPSRIMHRISDADTLLLSIGHGYALTVKTKILILYKPLIKAKGAGKSIADIVILSGNPQTTVSALLQTVQCKQLVIDSSNPGWKINLWKAECEKIGQPYFSVAEKGAFVLNLN